MTQQSTEQPVQPVATEVQSPAGNPAAGADELGGPNGQPLGDPAASSEIDPTPPAGADPLAAGSRLASQPGQPGQPQTGSAQFVPVTESIRYRRRAQQAERRLAELQQQLDQQQQSRVALETELAAARRRNELTGLLAGRGVIDLEAALLLAEQRLTGDGRAAPAHGAAGAGCPSPQDGLAIEDVIEQLLKDKPYLVGVKSADPPPANRPATSIATPTQGRRSRPSGLELLRSAAQRASGTGRGPELENYLRLRRRMK